MSCRESIAWDYEREQGIRQAINLFGYDEEDFEEEEDEEEDEPISDDILETEYDGDGI